MTQQMTHLATNLFVEYNGQLNFLKHEYMYFFSRMQQDKALVLKKEETMEVDKEEERKKEQFQTPAIWHQEEGEEGEEQDQEIYFQTTVTLHQEGPLKVKEGGWEGDQEQ